MPRTRFSVSLSKWFVFDLFELFQCYVIEDGGYYITAVGWLAKWPKGLAFPVFMLYCNVVDFSYLVVPSTYIFRYFVLVRLEDFSGKEKFVEGRLTDGTGSSLWVLLQR